MVNLQWSLMSRVFVSGASTTVKGIRSLLHKRCGIWYENDRVWFLEGILADVCMKKSVSLEEIEHALRHGHRSRLVQYLYEGITNQHTYFFREPEILNDFCTIVLPKISRDSNTRIWSAATSTGEETYTLAILMSQHQFSPKKVQILGTDISKKSLDHAVCGFYNLKSLRHVPRDVQNTYFDVGKNEFTISSTVRSYCSFSQFNLSSNIWEPLGLFHVSFLRNVLYYFSEEKQKSVLQNVWERTVPGGWLVTGINDSLRYLHTSWIQVSSCIFQKPLYSSNGTLQRVSSTQDKLLSPAFNYSPRLSISKTESLHSCMIYALGASTGGVSALLQIIPLFPVNNPPMVIAVHMPKDFTRSFAAQLNAITMLDVQEAHDGEILEAGMIRIAPGSDSYFTVVKNGSRLVCKLSRTTEHLGNTSSVDALFYSISQLKIPAVAALMTGMGKDGAHGLQYIKKNGGYTIVQDEESSVIYGMPRVAWERNAAYKRVDLLDIPIAMKRGERHAREMINE